MPPSYCGLGYSFTHTFRVPCDVRIWVAWLPPPLSVVHVPSTAWHCMPVVQSSAVEHSCVQYDLLPSSKHMPLTKMLLPRHFVECSHAMPAGSASLCLTPM